MNWRNYHTYTETKELIHQGYAQLITEHLSKGWEGYLLTVITHALCQRRFQALTVARMVPKTVAPGVRRAVSTTVRIAASP